MDIPFLFTYAAACDALLAARAPRPPAAEPVGFLAAALLATARAVRFACWTRAQPRPDCWRLALAWSWGSGATSALYGGLLLMLCAAAAADTTGGDPVARRWITAPGTVACWLAYGVSCAAEAGYAAWRAGWVRERAQQRIRRRQQRQQRNATVTRAAQEDASTREGPLWGNAVMM